ncbi:MAG: hypothetical protein NUV72_07035 [Bauldia sp.]|nr:hypothetical protein [Bauldia sp.]
MTRRILSALLFGTALAFSAAAAPGAASADGCLSQGELRAAVESGQAIPLKSVLAQIRATGGEIQGIPALCNIGGRLVYMVSVKSGGQVTSLQVDGQTGTISY